MMMLRVSGLPESSWRFGLLPACLLISLSCPPTAQALCLQQDVAGESSVALEEATPIGVDAQDVVESIPAEADQAEEEEVVLVPAHVIPFLRFEGRIEKARELEESLLQQMPEENREELSSELIVTDLLSELESVQEGGLVYAIYLTIPEYGEFSPGAFIVAAIECSSEIFFEEIMSEDMPAMGADGFYAVDDDEMLIRAAGDYMILLGDMSEHAFDRREVLRRETELVQNQPPGNIVDLWVQPERITVADRENLQQLVEAGIGAQQQQRDGEPSFEHLLRSLPGRFWSQALHWLLFDVKELRYSLTRETDSREVVSRVTIRAQPDSGFANWLSRQTRLDNDGIRTIHAQADSWVSVNLALPVWLQQHVQLFSAVMKTQSNHPTDYTSVRAELPPLLDELTERGAFRFSLQSVADESGRTEFALMMPTQGGAGLTDSMLQLISASDNLGWVPFVDEINGRPLHKMAFPGQDWNFQFYPSGPVMGAVATAADHCGLLKELLDPERAAREDLLPYRHTFLSGELFVDSLRFDPDLWNEELNLLLPPNSGGESARCRISGTTRGEELELEFAFNESAGFIGYFSYQYSFMLLAYAAEFVFE